MVSQRKDKTSYSVIGAMAGSSMDGLDLAHVFFKQTDHEWSYQLGKCETIEYPKDLYDRLKESPQQTGKTQKELDNDLGIWIAHAINDFKKDLPGIDLLGLHGHTVIHRPENKISWQLGNGYLITEGVEIPTVTDFRTEDVQNGGQGAPLVPFGDFVLFNEFDACLNLGGIANISLKGSQTAWDICPCNQVLNFFAGKLGRLFDEGGNLARTGNLDTLFHSKISVLEYFSLASPKSLPNNFIDQDLLNLVVPKDGLYTYCRIISEQIQKSLPVSSGSKLFLTGGGAFNTFLVELIREKLEGWDVVVPEAKLVSFKESLVFAFLALKRLRNEINVLATVTGSSKDSSSGVVHLP